MKLWQFKPLILIDFQDDVWIVTDSSAKCGGDVHLVSITTGKLTLFPCDIEAKLSKVYIEELGTLIGDY